MPMSPSATRVRDPRNLLPAANTHGVQVFMPVVPSERISPFTFGRGTVLWRIWPAVLLHTVFAALVITISDYTVKLAIPNVLLTVCGVVIGFVLSYRASSGYDRYWMGRSAWGDLMRNARTLARLIWFHVPARLTPGTEPAPEHEARQVMREKRMAIKLIEGFAVATKHHLRGEMTIFYQDLFPIVEPLHLHPRRERGPPPEEEPKKRPSLLVSLGSRISSAVSKVSSRSSSSSLAKGKQSANASASSLSVPGALSASPAASTDLLLPASPPHVSIHIAEPPPSTPANAPAVTFAPSSDRDVLLPKAANGNGAYGTFSDLPDSPATLKPIAQPNPSELSLSPSETSSENGSEDEHHCGEDCDHEHTPLFPSSLSDADRAKLPKIATELVAFSSFVEMLSPTNRRQAPPPARGQQPPIDGQPMSPTGSAVPDDASVMQVDPVDYVSHYDRKHRPRIPGGGENIPLQVLWCISDWLATCEKRNTVPGTSLGTTIATIGALEDALGQLEKILMTPLPFVYSVHIRVVWVYMFCMPFQLVDPFGVWTIPGVAIAAFFFLGLLAAGEEIEQPFGYDENDLNLDLFTNEMVHNELAELVHTPGINVLQRRVGANGTIAGLCAPRHPHVDSDAPRERPKSAYVAAAPAAPGHSHDAVPQHIACASEVPHVPVHHDAGAVHALPVTSQ